MTWSSIVGRTSKMVTDNSPSILTGFAVAGTVMTAYLTGKASFKATQLIQERERTFESNHPDYMVEPLTPREKVELVWKLYIPAASSLLATLVFVVGANRVGARRAAGLAAAYALSERTYEAYKEKVIEKLGERKEQAVRDEIAQERVTRNPPPADLVVYEETGSVLCCDLFTGRYLLSDMESLRRAENQINYQVMHDYYASLTDFYERIGLEKTSMSDDFGWNADKMMELEFSTTLTPQGRPCLTFNFRVAPIRGYHRLQ